MTEWFYSLQPGQQEGPVDADDLALLHADGQLRPDSLVWREGMSAWVPWREAMAEVLPAAAQYSGQHTGQPAGQPIPPGVATQGGAADAGAAQFATFATAPAAAVDDGAHRPYAIAEPLASPYAPPKARIDERAAGPVRGHVVVYAGFWKRFAAWFIDSIVVGLASVVIAVPIGLIAALLPGNDVESLLDSSAFDALGQVISWVVSAWYFGWMYASSHQASLGKMAVGIKVVRGNGEALSFWRGFWRTFAQFLSGLILLIGYIMAAFTERRQALHDMICDTLVVDKWAYTDQPQFQDDSLGTVTIVILCFAGLAFVALVAILMAAGLALTSGLR